MQGTASASCALVGDYSTGTSYGALPCNLCPSSQPICLVIKDNTKGTCTCLQSGEPVLQSCTRADAADRVFPDASQLCAITLDYRRVSTQTAISIDWNSLAAAPCVLISPSNAYCYNVPGYGFLVVGLGIVDASYRRRLLGMDSSNADDDDSEDVQRMLLYYKVASFSLWNNTARPCNILAQAAMAARTTQNMSIMDAETLRLCVHWRQIGRDAIRELNLTSVSAIDEDDENDANRIFMSLEDFASVASSRCLCHPPILIFHVGTLATFFSQVFLDRTCVYANFFVKHICKFCLAKSIYATSGHTKKFAKLFLQNFGLVQTI